MTQTLTRYRTGRNWVTVGDIVKVTPRVGASFLAEVTRIDADSEGNPAVVNVTIRAKCNGSRHRFYGMSRAFSPDNLTRISKPKAQKLLGD